MEVLQVVELTPLVVFIAIVAEATFAGQQVYPYPFTTLKVSKFFRRGADFFEKFHSAFLLIFTKDTEITHENNFNFSSTLKQGYATKVNCGAFSCAPATNPQNQK